MSKTIVQKVLFKSTTAKTLYNLYMNARLHALVTGAPATITATVGSKYSVYDGYIKGKNLQLVKDRLIVQTWRAEGWDKKDIDSTFIINLEPKGNDVILHVTHANLPSRHAGHTNKGWYDHYWNPWKQYLAGNAIKPYSQNGNI